jgi:hypothetical protein
VSESQEGLIGDTTERLGSHDVHLVEELEGIGGPEDFSGLLDALLSA